MLFSFQIYTSRVDGLINRFHDKGEEEQNLAAGEQVVVHTWVQFG